MAFTRPARHLSFAQRGMGGIPDRLADGHRTERPGERRSIQYCSLNNMFAVACFGGEPQMARTVAELPKGARITNYISLGVLTKTFPLDRVNAAVAATGKTSRRQRDLPAPVVLYYVIALTLYMQVSYRADNQDNEKALGRPPASRGSSAYPQVRFVSLVENGRHVLFGTQLG